MKWVSSFRYLSLDNDGRVAAVRDRTQRLSFGNNLNGSRVRLRFSNRFSRLPLRLDAVSIGVRAADGAIRPVPVTLSGSAVITLAPGQEAFSDEVELSVRAGDRPEVNIYIGEGQDVEAVCCFWSKTDAFVTFGQGDRTDGGAMEPGRLDDLNPMYADETSPDRGMFFFGFDAVQVLTDDGIRVIAAFGDSITHMGYITNALAKRLYAAYPGRVSLVNCGIGGNRLLSDPAVIPDLGKPLAVFGKAGVSRFEEDVFGLEQADAVLTLMGINDIMHPLQLEGAREGTPAERIVDGMTRIAGIAHDHGARFYAATVTAEGNPDYPAEWMAAFEKERLALNEWIRSNDVCDGFFDYDAALRDETRPGYLRHGTHLGDGLHPNDAGGALAAAEVDLKALTGLD